MIGEELRLSAQATGGPDAVYGQTIQFPVRQDRHKLTVIDAVRDEPVRRQQDTEPRLCRL